MAKHTLGFKNFYKYADMMTTGGGFHKTKTEAKAMANWIRKVHGVNVRVVKTDKSYAKHTGKKWHSKVQYKAPKRRK